MITRRMKIRRHLRSVRTSALTEAERRQELREAEARSAHGRGKPVEPEAPPPRAMTAPLGLSKHAPGGPASVNPADAGPPVPLPKDSPVGEDRV